MGEEEEKKKRTQQVAIFISKLFQIRTSRYIAVCASIADCDQLRTLLADRCQTTAPPRAALCHWLSVGYYFATVSQTK